MAVAPVLDTRPRSSHTARHPARSLVPSLHEVVLPCLRIGLVGALAVAYLMLSARVSAMEIQRANLDKRIEAEQARRMALLRAYQSACERNGLQRYASAAGLQQQPSRVQTMDMPPLPAGDPGMLARLERPPVLSGKPGPPVNPGGQVVAGMSP